MKLLNKLNGKKTVIGALILAVSKITGWLSGEEAIDVSSILEIVDIVGVGIVSIGIGHKAGKRFK